MFSHQFSTSAFDKAAMANLPFDYKTRLLEERQNAENNSQSPEKKGYQLLGEGYTSKIYHIPNSDKVIKSFPAKNEKHFLAEKAAYELLSSNNPPSSIPAYYDTSPDFPLGIVLSRANHGDVYEYLYRARRMGPMPMPTKKDFYHWAKQAAQALAYAHSMNIMHADIHLVNFLFTSSLTNSSQLDLQVADWAGATIHGSKSASWYRLTHQLWTPERKERDEEGKKIDMKIDVKSEIFALGSAIYHMVGGNDLWEGELEQKGDRDEIVRRLKAKEMPGCEGLVCLRNVVERCWAVDFAEMEEVVKAIEDEEREDEESGR